MGFSSKARVTKSRSIARVTAPPAAQIFSPTGASLVAEGGTPTVGGLNVSPTGAQLVTQGGTPVYGGINARPTGASLVVQGGTPVLGAPQNIPGLLAWYTADSITGKIDNDPVSSWSDISGNGNTIVQATGTRQPLYKTNIQNSLPAVKFDGAAVNADYMDVAFTMTDNQVSVFVVFSYHTATAGSTVVCDGKTNSLDFLSGAGPSNCYYGTSGGNLASGVTPTAGSWFIASGISSAPHTKEVHVNGGIGATDSNATTGVTTNPGGVTLGAQRTGTGFMAPVYIGEYLVYDASLDASQRQQVEAYLATKWAVTLT